MKSTKPTIFFDLESTGISTTTDRILQIGVIKLHPDGTSTTTSTRRPALCRFPFLQAAPFNPSAVSEPLNNIQIENRP